MMPQAPESDAAARRDLDERSRPCPCGVHDLLVEVDRQKAALAPAAKAERAAKVSAMRRDAAAFLLARGFTDATLAPWADEILRNGSEDEREFASRFFGATRGAA
jgi:hypothetical protein